MKNKLLIFYISLLVPFLGCIDNQSDSSKKLEKTEKYSNGGIKFELWNFDTVKVAIKYNREGMVLDSIPFNKDTLIHGKRKVLDVKDSIYSYINYVNGMGQGNVIAYYVNGKLAGKGQNKNNKRVGEWIYYYKNKNIMYYKYYNYNGKLLLNATYNIDGEIDKIEGKGIGHIELNKDTVKVGSPFVCKVYVAKPPKCKVQVFVAEEIIDEKNPVLDEFYEYELDGNSYIYSKVFDKPGIYQKRFAWLLTDVNDSTITDFKLLDIIVVRR